MWRIYARITLDLVRVLCLSRAIMYAGQLGHLPVVQIWAILSVVEIWAILYVAEIRANLYVAEI